MVSFAVTVGVVSRLVVWSRALATVVVDLAIAARFVVAAVAVAIAVS